MASSPVDASGQIALDANALASLKLQAKSDPKKALSAAAGQFEALFMQMLLKSMREALPKDGPLESESTKAYTGMFDQQIAQQLAKKSIGVADMLVRQLSGTVKPAATSGVSGTDGSLLPKTLPLPTPAGVPKAASAVAPASSPPTGSVSSTVQGFIDKLRPYAEAVAQKMGVPAQYLIAQAGLETGWGKSLPKSADGTDSRNLFGVKATSSWKGAVVQATTTEYTAGRAEKTQAGFRAYGSYAESLQDFAKLLQSSRRYAGALANSHDAGKYAASLQKAGYATDPHYGEKLARAIETVSRHAPATAKPAPAQVSAGAADKRLDLV